MKKVSNFSREIKCEKFHVCKKCKIKKNSRDIRIYSTGTILFFFWKKNIPLDLEVIRDLFP